MEIQTIYQNALKYAAGKHAELDQKVPGTNFPYVVHLSNVAMEILIASSHTQNFDLEFAVQVALLHDTIEDTSATYEEIESLFGREIADGVLALTKNESLAKEDQMNDSLERIRKLRKEVWAVKLADRITNLQPPPDNWDRERRKKYLEQAGIILNELQDGNKYLSGRLRESMEEYKGYAKEA